MILHLMMYILLVTLLIAASARMLEKIIRDFRFPTRYVWLGALLLTAAMVAVAPLRTYTVPNTMAAEVVQVPEKWDNAASASTLQTNLTGKTVNTLRQLRDWPMIFLASRTSEKAGMAAGAIWLLFTLFLLIAGAMTLGRYQYLRKRWPLVSISGYQARLTPGTGPAVVGVIRPEIVVPEWLFEASDEERNLIVIHEQEHLRVRDPVVLFLGCLIAALIPWNPIVWWMLYRLRLGVELDCDARVIRKGALPGSYGSMLLDVAGRNSGFIHGLPAFSGSPSILNQRLLAMTTQTKRTSTPLTVIFTMLSMSLLFFACDSTVITDAEIIEELHETYTERANSDKSTTVRAFAGEGKPLFVIDGEIIEGFDLSEINPDQIESISVLKGEAAENLYKEEGKNGVIKIKLKETEQ